MYGRHDPVGQKTLTSVCIGGWLVANTYLLMYLNTFVQYYNTTDKLFS